MSVGRRLGAGVVVMLLVGALAAPAAAIDGGHKWTRQFGTLYYDEIKGVAADDSGVYFGGNTSGPLRGANKGSTDGFVRKYDHYGKHLWTRQFGTYAVDAVNGVAVDATGVYAAGHTYASLQGTSKGNYDGFVRKYDHDGKHLWTRQFGTSLYEEAFGVAAAAGWVYVGGTTIGSLQGTVKGGTDAFIRKYSPDGKHQWTRQFGGPEDEGARGVAADASGVYAAGTTSGDLQGTNQGAVDGFMRKYGPDGKHQWTRQFGTNLEEYVWGVAVHGTSVYAVGQTAGLMQGTYKGSSDGFIRMYGLNGHGTWTRQFGTTTADMAFGIAAHGSGVYAGGRTKGSFRGTNQGDFDALVRVHGTA